MMEFKFIIEAQRPAATDLDLKFAFEPGHDASKEEVSYTVPLGQFRKIRDLSTLNNQAKNRLLDEMSNNTREQVQLWGFLPYMSKASQNIEIARLGAGAAAWLSRAEKLEQDADEAEKVAAQAAVHARMLRHNAEYGN